MKPKFGYPARTLAGVTRITDIGADQLDRPRTTEFRKAGEYQ